MYRSEIKQLLLILSVLGCSFSQSSEPLESKIRAAQNPIADRVFFGLQNLTGFGLGPNDRVRNITNIQPVAAFGLGPFLNVTTRLNVPLIYEPDPLRNTGGHYGLGDLITSFYFNPKTKSPFAWGGGPTFLFPTATHDSLGADQWAVGGSVIAEYNQANWLTGVLINNIWSYAGLKNRPDIDLFTLQPYINYIIPGTNGLTVITSPVITANWELSGDKWTVPLGGGLGYLLRFGEWSTFLTVQSYANVASTGFRPDWILVTTAQLLFPK